ncbi:MAG: MBOAT family O-acyltransferase [Bacillota bacterium]|nr:MBOAT family O-acyltransferase [Bacillota bacterium]
MNNKLKNGWLLFMSLLFYAWGGIKFFPIICISILLNYIGGYLIDCVQTQGKEALRKSIFFMVIVFNLLLLGYWKYFMFFVNIFEEITGIQFHVPEIVLPIGISFFTFQGLSYVIDVYRRKVPVQKKLLNVGLYIALFPQLIAGPIVRYSDINEQIEFRTHSTSTFVEGIRRFTIGLAKKAILANSLAVNADSIFHTPYYNNTPEVAWIGAVSYSLQIYFDFSGYSDMAIGLGKMFGFHILDNFNYPYISKSISEFWRRWHISLGSWLRDYVYIPLGGNRKGKAYTIINTLIVFGISGLWHGANWTFIVWGIYYGFLIVLPIIFGKTIQNFHQKFAFSNTRLFNFVKIVCTDFLVLIGWVLFKSDSLSAAIGYLKSMFGLVNLYQPGYTYKWYLTNYNIFILIISFVAMLPLGKKLFYALKAKITNYVFEVICDVSTFILLAVSLMYVVTSTYNPFIYFQF